MMTDHRIVLFSFLIMIYAHLASGQPIAKPGCPSQCGDVSVPYPFGIGAGCSLDEWFEIVCGNGTTPSLKNSTELLVTDIIF